MDYAFLQQYWWFIISLLGGLLVFLLFVQGGQSMIFSLAKTEKHRFLLVNALGRKWEYTFTTLVTFGGAAFASFPLFYSTSFGGAYWVWMAILFCFVIQAVSYEFQSKPGNTYGKNTYRSFLFINGLLGTFLLGVAVATFFTGSDFVVNKGNIAIMASLTDPTASVISGWANPWHGLEALLNFRNWCLGLTVFFLSRTLACLFFINRMQDEDLVKRSQKFLIYNGVPFVVFFLAFVIWTFFSEGFGVDAEGIVSMVQYKYFLNLVEMPIVGITFLVGVLLVLYGIIRSVLASSFRSGIWSAGIGTVLTVCCLFLITGLNNTAYYPSTHDLQSSLTIYNSSSSEFTLTAMAYVSILVPFVLGYIIYAWRALEKKKFDGNDLKEDGHVY